jgi:quinoprotein glucose dehydrogenase
MLAISRLCAAACLLATLGPGQDATVRAQRQGPSPVVALTPTTPQVVQRLPGEVSEKAATARREAAVKLAEGLDLQLWADESLLYDPIAIDIDGQGRLYATQTGRRRNPDIDIRQHRDWMTTSLTFRTVDDRRAFLRRTLAPERSADNAWLDDVNKDGSRDWRDLLVKKERISRIEDTNGDGVADRSTVLIEDFHTEETDVAGGLVVSGNDMYVAVSPDLWRLRDTNGDGTLDTKQSLMTGFHLHIGYGGHGMSGATLGPDGRIYWSIGDVGMNAVDANGRRWDYRNQGVIVRANPDGSDFEVFAAGLRNTHEFTFDEHGNLISVDNDGDHAAENERIVYITDGQDSGWRINWQFGKYTDPDNNAYRVWMDEGMFKPRFEGQAAWFTPPVAAYDGGPAGMVYNPGTAMSDRWKRHFFVADFTGARANSRINTFQLTPQGAGFAARPGAVALTGILATGLKFGPDGALYVADWLEGWGTKSEGRIWKLDVPGAAASPARVETRALLAEEFGNRPAADLRRLLAHDDMRVRLKAQFALATRGDVQTLLAAAVDAKAGLAALHGVWGVAQLARADTRHGSALQPLLRATDPEVRAQAAKMLGDIRHAAAADDLIALLRDSADRPRFFAAEALGRIAYRRAVQPIVAMLEANDDRDVYLRHAGTLALARIGDVEPVAALSTHRSRAVRIAAVVALRRMRSPELARFLTDADEFIVAEAARAINDDGGIDAALPSLARVLGDPRFSSAPLIRRAVNASLRVGTPEAAARLASLALGTVGTEALRIEAIDALGVWGRPSVLDRVDGWYHGPAQARDAGVARAALEPIIDPLLATGSPGVKIAIVGAVARLDIKATRPALLARVRDDGSPEVRMAALRALRAIGIAGAEAAVSAALADEAAPVRMTAIELLPALGLPGNVAVDMLRGVLESGAAIERQRAVTTLGQLATPEADRVIAGLLERLPGGDVPAEIQLEVLETARTSTSPQLRAAAERYDAARPSGSVAASRRELLIGGDAAAGRRVTLSAVAQCSQCHSVEVAGATVGPRLTGVGSRLSREELLASLMDPSARIAPGFGIVGLTLRSGEQVTGRIVEETAVLLTVETGEARTVQVPMADIARRENAPSPMPPAQLFLSPREIRDVVEYLTTR